MTGHSDRVTFVAWNNDGSKLATGSRDSTVKTWAVGSAGTFECQSTLRLDAGSSGVTSVSFFMGDVIAVGCDNGKIHLIDVAEGSLKRSLIGHRYRQKL